MTLSVFTYFLSVLWCVVPSAQHTTGVFQAKTMLVLDVHFEAKSTGTLYVAVYNSESSWNKTDQLYLKQTAAVKNQNSVKVSVEGLAAGKYSVAVFLDENGNQMLDTNWMGIPIEGYGYSNGVRPKYRAATWAETCMSLEANATKTERVDVKKWRL